MPMFLKGELLEVKKLVPLNGETTVIDNVADLVPVPAASPTINTSSSNSVVDTSQQFNDLLRN